MDGAFTLEVLKISAIPSDITALGAEGIKNIWHNVKLRGRGYSRANEIVSYAEKSVGLTDAGREAMKWYAEQILRLDEQLAEIESALHEKCREIPYAENILAIICYGHLYDILDTGMLSESKENPVRPIPLFPFAGLLLRDNGNSPNGILLQFRTWQLHSIDYCFFAWYHK